METLTVVLAGEFEPQLLCAVTLTVPPDEPTVALIVLVVELPLHVAGSVHE